ncbi:hypothetical protein MOQ_001694 [Trypanosoma cruzi marinkellei]|uniref:Uncharacterized protein n=1 Tax=Trypanosoma cruzi marinkellei TaxID=85056 RepID=K2NK74_TRYCR|nr:hypothetical protein MOQ_001694 [Trypanosoma cruzi marinkellei]
MTLSRPQLLCPVLLDIGSSRSVTLPQFHDEVRPSLLKEVDRILARQAERSRLPQQSSAALATSPELWIRPCGFSAEQPLLQHDSWKMPWQAHIHAVRQRGRMPSAAAAPQIGRERETVPLFGTPSLPLSVCVSNTAAKGEEGVTMMMDFFRVDAFIPVHVQMYHVMRRILERRDLWDVAAVGVVVPTHHTEYFMDAARRMHERVSRSTLSACDDVPNVLVYNPKGLQFQSP